MADTSLRQRADFPEVKDKILNEIEVSSDSEYFGITIRFQDNTTLNFTVEPSVVVFPVLAAWQNGECQTSCGIGNLPSTTALGIEKVCQQNIGQLQRSLCR